MIRDAFPPLRDLPAMSLCFALIGLMFAMLWNPPETARFLTEHLGAAADVVFRFAMAVLS